MLASAVLLTALESAAQPEPPTRVQLAFKAPASCADNTEFERRVRQRSDRIVFVSEAPYTGSAKVTLEPTTDSVRVRVSWSREGDSATGREFSATSCAEAMDAAALVIAISFDPSAPEAAAAPSSADSGTDQSDADPNADPTNPADAGESPGAAGSADQGATDAKSGAATSPEARTLAPPASDRTAPEPRGSDSAASFGAIALVDGISGVAPATMAGLGLGLDFAIGQSWWSPQLRFAGIHYFGVTYAADGGDAHFELDTFEFEGCPLRLGSNAVWLRPCAAVTGGRLVASGRSTQNPNSHTRSLWVVGGALVLGVRPTSLLIVSADVSVGAPTTRDSFQFAPDEFHQVSSMIVSGSVGLGVEFR